MSSELSRSLVDAAAEAMRVTANDEAAFGEHATWGQLGPSAVAAVLETLAAEIEQANWPMSISKLRRLAAEVSAVPDGQ